MKKSIFILYLFLSACIWREGGQLPKITFPDAGGTAGAPKQTRQKRTRQSPTTGSRNTASSNPDMNKGEAFEGKAVHIADGDTFDLLTDDTVKIRIRMQGIDAPEKAQAFGQVAKDNLGRLLKDSRIKIVVANKDRYGRAVCEVYALRGASQHWINRQMIADGLAWHYTQYSKSPELAAAEQQARAQKRGLWADPQAVAPWEYRARKREHTQ